MKELLVLLAHLSTMIANLLGPVGTGAVIAIFEHLIDSFWASGAVPQSALYLTGSSYHQVINTAEIPRSTQETQTSVAVFISYKSKPEPIPGTLPATIEMKRRNPRFCCPKIAEQISEVFGVDINKDIARRVVAKYYIPEIDELKSIPYTPCYHPFIARFIGTIRREYFDHTFFWNVADLESKFADSQIDYNHHRTHSLLDGDTPDEAVGGAPKLPVTLKNFRWQIHCRGLYLLPVAACLSILHAQVDY